MLLLIIIVCDKCSRPSYVMGRVRCFQRINSATPRCSPEPSTVTSNVITFVAVFELSPYTLWVIQCHLVDLFIVQRSNQFISGWKVFPPPFPFLFPFLSFFSFSLKSNPDRRCTKALSPCRKRMRCRPMKRFWWLQMFHFY